MKREMAVRTREAISYLSYVSAFLAFSFICLWTAPSQLVGGNYFWDARVYVTAIATWRAGGNPYVFDVSTLPFLYPPVVLELATRVAPVFPAHSGWYLYLIIFGAATFALPWVLANYYLCNEWMTPVVAAMLFAIQPGFFIERVTLSGNIAVILYMSVLVAGIAGIRRHRWTAFYVAVILACLIKPSFLTFLIVPALGRERQFARSAVSGGIVGLFYVVQRFFAPGLYAAFERVAYLEIIVKRDVGFGPYLYLLVIAKVLSPSHGLTIALIVHFCMMGVLISGLFFLRKRGEQANVAHLWIPMLIVVAIVSNPRLLEYDMEIAVLPAIYICVECMKHSFHSRSGIAAATLLVVAIVGVSSNNFKEGMCLLLVTSIALVVQRLLREDIAAKELSA